MSGLPKARLFDLDISTGSFEQHVAAIAALGREHRSSYVCCVNVHMCMEAQGDPRFAAIVNGADLATADGMPILNGLNKLTGLQQGRVAGNDLLPAILEEAEKQNLGVFLHGGEQSTLEAIVDRAAREFPALRIVDTYSPPFRTATAEERTAEAERIVASGANIVLVSLGCPRQERWMAEMKGQVPAVMLGLGGAFLLYAGLDRRAPKWMRDASLEWAFRLWLEPDRLWKRYLFTNSKFLILRTKEQMRRRREEVD